MENAPACASVTLPSAKPLANHVISLDDNLVLSRNFAMIERASKT